jgi:hypothetical protein
MKAISVQQPWAWAIFNGKPVENRTWSTSYRGPLLIHAGKKFDGRGWWEFLKIWEPLGIAVPDTVNVMERGGFIGIVDLIDCVHKHDSPWFFGPRGLVLANPRRIEFVPYPGRLGIFEVPEGVVKT